MSDPTLIERLVAGELSVIDEMRLRQEVAARIAELEALSAPDAIQRHYMRGYNAANANRRSYVAELEAERDRLKAATREAEQFIEHIDTDDARHLNSVLRAALSGEGVT